MQIVIGIIFYRRQYNAFELPVHQIFGGVATDTGYIRPVTFPRSPFRQYRFPFFILAIPIIRSFMIKQTSSMCINRIAVRIVPHLSRLKIRILHFVSLHTSRQHQAGNYCQKKIFHIHSMFNCYNLPAKIRINPINPILIYPTFSTGFIFYPFSSLYWIEFAIFVQHDEYVYKQMYTDIYLKPLYILHQTILFGNS